MEQEKESEVPETVNRNVQQQDSRNLYRCQRCLRAYHEGCLSSVNNDGNIMNASNMDRERQRFEENWRCDDCIKYSKGVDIILTWRVIGESGDKEMEVDFDDVSPSKREYLIKWQDTGYTNLDWVSENWLKSIAKAKLKNFCDRQQHGEYMTVDKVVPKDYLTIERILTAEDSNGDIITTEDIHQVEKVFVKYHGLNYDHIYWDTPPPSDSHLYSSFRTAFHNYLLACEVDPPKDMGEQVELVRKLATQENYGKHELKQQPDFVRGGTLMPHQLDGLNWLIFQWEQEMGCVLADDMGLGKTIQIVTFLNFLLTKYRIYPFAIVVPLSTATNWLREFAKWAPEMVVVPYHGSSESRKRALKYEIFRGGSKKMRCHAIIFTYESATFDSQLIPKVDFWPVLVVDEAQRLKNDNSLLFQKLLHTIRFDHPILMTGTPLQNNIRELINIMHFVDRNKFANVRELEGKYSELSHTTVQNLHDQLKPYFLRRTKDVVLKTLPPKTEIIVPVSMSSLQKEVYKDLLEHNLKSYAQLTTVDQSRPNTVKKMSNILMQLRKTLGHPYLIQDIEIKQKDAATTHQVLIDACAKLKVLHQMLPKLKRDGHRVLIFSTLKGTLDILEDYLMYEQCKYVRIDGDTPSNERVANIDQFNAPNSDVFVFLLTTRAGGVGINLATADTVIMWDFDFNPHADLQAICRAYRIGQTRPVLILRFMTRLSVEEKIAQIAKKKMILDHLVVDKMDDDDLEEDDVESIIKFGAQALFERDDSKRITYDSAGIDKLLDRNTDVTREETIDQPEQSGMKHMSFSFAKVWNLDNDAATEDLSADEDKDKAEDDNFWEKFLALKKLQVEAAEQRKKEELGRGARKRTVVVSLCYFFLFPL
ncbi:P-loop containing nucleoside triphosphate hydrolase protein [Phascolomyces articulosus]|uniref:P-loop containing nucleoside triphosphate hydrolase protein n=1 Tax=Phascolomyces articulosus TaxID=60185 RepID=A0AAD5PCS8_9FUNG|nr:P-loop containing nucleoside triphosphate hydrolase protein [Phascolomyces articulosus]